MKRVNKLATTIIVFLLMISVNIKEVKAVNAEVTEVKVKEKSETIGIETPVLESNKITSDVIFNEKNDYVIFELTLKNSESYKYKIESVEDNNKDENLVLEYSYDKEYIDADGTGELNVKVTYKNKLINKVRRFKYNYKLVKRRWNK